MRLAPHGDFACEIAHARLGDLHLGLNQADSAVLHLQRARALGLATGTLELARIRLRTSKPPIPGSITSSTGIGLLGVGGELQREHRRGHCQGHRQRTLTGVEGGLLPVHLHHGRVIGRRPAVLNGNESADDRTAAAGGP